MVFVGHPQGCCIVDKCIVPSQINYGIGTTPKGLLYSVDKYIVPSQINYSIGRTPTGLLYSVDKYIVPSQINYHNIAF